MKILKLNKEQFGTDALITLFRGDDWAIEGKIVNSVGGVDEDVDLTGNTLKAYFPQSDTTLPALEIDCTIINAESGKIKIELSKTQSALIALVPQGISFYIILSNTATSKATTVETQGEPLGVKDHEFRNF